MRTLLFVTLVVAACGGGDKTPAPTNPTPPGPPALEPTTDASCAQEIAASCDEGEIDGCLSGVTLAHACVAADAAAGPSCDTRILVECAAGYVDGCTTTPPLSATHVCARQLAADPAP